MAFERYNPVKLLHTCGSHRHRFSNFHNNFRERNTLFKTNVWDRSPAGIPSQQSLCYLSLTDFPQIVMSHNLWRKQNSRLGKEKQLANRNLSSRSN